MKTDELKKEREFSSPIGAFIFLILSQNDLQLHGASRFRPLSGLLFS